ncbi:MAG: aldehyde dehydrogenase family protein [Pyrinomonadaceae bacterium]
MADKGSLSDQSASDAVESAHNAFLDLMTCDQSKVDAICEAMASAALRDAARLGQMAFEETGFGVADDKREKNRFAAEDVWNYFKGLRTVGVVSTTESRVEIVSPRGVVAAIIPSTNPTSTTIFKIIISIKSRNAIVLSPHPAAAKSILETARIMKAAGMAAGLNGDAIQCLENASQSATDELMKHRKTAVILATGGPGLVRAAYSSGKPAFGVGPGNVPVFIEKSANVSKAVADILTGTCFDNGTICASEQSVVVDASIASAVRNEFTARGGHFLNPREAEKVGSVLVTGEGKLNAGIVGKPAKYIADLAGVAVPSETRCLLADCGGVGREYPWSVEKLSPTLAFFEVNGVAEGAALCEKILRFGGMGHTAGMHTGDRDAAVSFGEKMPASRVVINSPTTHGAIGFSTDLSPSMTLGCGSWGGNVTSDNVSPLHLMDVKRVAFETRPVNSASRETSGTKRPKITREDIAALVDGFLSAKLSERPSVESVPQAPPAVVHSLLPKEEVPNTSPVEFVCEDDVRDAVKAGQRIYISEKTIVTPAARDLGNEKAVFVEV